jgi:UDP-N-acetylglucosamine acyltransferase
VGVKNNPLDHARHISPIFTRDAGTLLGLVYLIMKINDNSENDFASQACIYQGVVFGKKNWVAPFAIIGSPGEIRDGILRSNSELRTQLDTGVIIGDRNVIREFATIQAGNSNPTLIGNDCYIMTKSHVPHDAILGNFVTVSSAAVIGGHSIIGDGANIGLSAVLHQFSVVGAGSMIGMGSVSKGAILPFSLGFGNPFRTKRVNRIGMARLRMAESDIDKYEKYLDQKDANSIQGFLAETGFLDNYLAGCAENKQDPWLSIKK